MPGWVGGPAAAAGRPRHKEIMAPPPQRRNRHGGKGGRGGGMGAAATAPNGGPLHNLPAPPPVSPMMDVTSLEEQLDGLLEVLQPCRQSEERRNAIFRFVKGLLQSRFPFLECYLMGSFPLKTYLPDSDLDMTICASNTTDDQQDQSFRGPSTDNDLLVLVNEALCRAAVLGPISTTPHRPGDAMEIRNIAFVNARTKVVNCTVQNVAVDITVNQLGSLASLTFLEEVDRTIGGNHLFKRSILLIKAWCLHESSKYVGVAILGSKSHGGLSSYALSVMVLSLFNGSHGGLHHPLQVFAKFLQVFSSFDWSQHLLTHNGPRPLSCTYESTMGSPRNDRTRFGVLVEQLKRYSEEAGPSPSFPQRSCNILDPLNSSNNLGYSLNRQSLQYMQHALMEGRLHLEHVLGSNLLALPTLVQGVCVGGSQGKGGSADRGLVTPESALWADGGSTDSYSGSDDGNQSDSSSKSGQGVMKPWASTLPPPPVNYAMAPKTGGGRGGLSPNPGVPTMADRANAALVAFFPRLYQLYASPSECRTDLLNHPCQSRTTLVCDDLPPGGCPPASKSALLSGDVISFWKNLSSTCGNNRPEKPCKTPESNKSEGSQGLWTSLTPKKLLHGPHKEYDDEEFKCTDETAIANSRSTATSSPCSLSSLSSASSPQPHESDGKDLQDHHFEPTALDLPPPSSTVPSPASRPSVINPRSPHGDRCTALDGYSSLHVPSSGGGGLSEGDHGHSQRRDPENGKTSERDVSEPVAADEMPHPPVSSDKNTLQEAAAASRGTSDDDVTSPPAAGAPTTSPCGKVAETKDVSCGGGVEEEDEEEPLALPSAEEDELGGSGPASSPGAARESTETGARTKKCGSRRRKKGTSLVVGGSPEVAMVSIGIQTDSAPHPAKQQPPETRRAPPPPLHPSSRGGKQQHKDKKAVVPNRKPPCSSHQDKGVQATEDVVADWLLKYLGGRGIVTISAILVLACIVLSLKAGFPSGHANQDPLSAAHLNDSAATLAMGSLPSSSSSHATTPGSRKEEAALPFWVVAGTTLRLGDVPMSPRSRKAHRSLPGGSTYRWYKDGVELEESSSPTSFLVIQRVSPQDEGNYSCYRVEVAQDKEERQELVGLTQVRVLQPPQLTTKRRIQTSLQPGSMLALHVAAVGVPEPEYQWRLNGVPIPGARSYTYTVRSVDASHMGTYTCEVWNLAGKVMWEEGVIAMAPPGPST